MEPDEQVVHGTGGAGPNGGCAGGRAVHCTPEDRDDRQVVTSLDELLTEVRGCTVCAADLPAGPKPIVQLGRSASIVIIGQAPGRRVHETGKPWDDASGDRLRSWLGLTPDQFYDPDTVAIVPMGLCYPGKGPSGDRPPRPECAPLWHPRLLEQLSEDRLEIIIGTYAQRRYVPDRAANLTETVARWERYLPGTVVLPHPSPRNAHWLTRNPWFEAETLPSVRRRIQQVVGRRPSSPAVTRTTDPTR